MSALPVFGNPWTKTKEPKGSTPLKPWCICPGISGVCVQRWPKKGKEERGGTTVGNRSRQERKGVDLNSQNFESRKTKQRIAMQPGTERTIDWTSSVVDLGLGVKNVSTRTRPA